MTEQKRPEISIIVAVYKGEKYLNGCVDAILNQTFRDFEVILVDDGSPDNCPAMCDAIAKRDSRVRVIHQKNKGVDGAKNAGIDSARGNWIGFVDQDDLIDKTYYEKLYHAAQQAGAEIAVSNILYMEADGSASVYKDLPLRDEVLTAAEAARRIRATPMVHVTSKLQRQELVKQTAFSMEKIMKMHLCLRLFWNRSIKWHVWQNRFTISGSILKVLRIEKSF